VRRAALVALVLAAAPSAASAAPTVTSGSLKATVHTDPWRVDYGVVDEAARSLAFTSGGVTAHATRATGGHMEGRAYVTTVRTDDPQAGRSRCA